MPCRRWVNPLIRHAYGVQRFGCGTPGADIHRPCVPYRLAVAPAKAPRAVRLPACLSSPPDSEKCTIRLGKA